MKYCITLSSMLLTTALSFAHADRYYDSQQGYTNNEPYCIDVADGNRVCTKFPQGTITQDALGNVVCGLGQCAADALGNQICSDQPNGHVRVDQMGDVACKGTCVPAAEQYCNFIPDGKVE